MKFSIYLAAFLPWGVLAPLNVLKLMLNAVSPTAHFWVPKETEQCQGACGIARMWAQLFWSLQFISALSFVYVHYHREQTGLVHMGIATKLVVGLLLLKAYLSGVIHWPIGLGGPCLDWALALGFALELRSRGAPTSGTPWGEVPLAQLSFLEDELPPAGLKVTRTASPQAAHAAHAAHGRASRHRCSACAGTTAIHPQGRGARGDCATDLEQRGGVDARYSFAKDEAAVTKQRRNSRGCGVE